MKTKTSTLYSVHTIANGMEMTVIGGLPGIRAARRAADQYLSGRRGRKPRMIARLTRTVVKTKDIEL